MKAKLLSLILRTVFKNYAIIKDVNIILAGKTVITKTEKSLIIENSVTEIKQHLFGNGVVEEAKVHIPMGGSGGNKI